MTALNQIHREPSIQLRVRAPSDSKGAGTIVVILALGALAYVAYHLYRLYREYSTPNNSLNPSHNINKNHNRTQKLPPLSARAQVIRSSFTHLQRDLNELDMINLAKQVESIEMQVRQSDRSRNPPNRPTLEKFQIKFRSASTHQKARFIVEIGQKNIVCVQRIAAKLGRGGCGKVIKLINLHNGAQTALKIATPPSELIRNQRYKQICEADLTKEHRNLMKVHTPNKIPPQGVQNKPLSDIFILTKSYKSRNLQSMKRVAYEGTLYDGSLDSLKIRTYPIKTRLSIAYHVILGIETLLQNGFILHDLKPQNILYRNHGGQFHVHVSDFGGITHKDELEKELDNGIIAHTPGFADTAQLESASSMPFVFLKRGSVRNSEKCSIGVTLFWILTESIASLNTSDQELEQLWRNAGLALKGKHLELFNILKGYMRNSSPGVWAGVKGFVSELMDHDLDNLKKSIHALAR